MPEYETSPSDNPKTPWTERPDVQELLNELRCIKDQDTTRVVSAREDISIRELIREIEKGTQKGKEFFDWYKSADATLDRVQPSRQTRNPFMRSIIRSALERMKNTLPINGLDTSS